MPFLRSIAKSPRIYPALARAAVLHDVTNAPAHAGRSLQPIKPDVIFHAAAHKHVPMMENHPAAGGGE